MWQRLILASAFAFSIQLHASGDTVSVGPTGANATGLMLPNGMPLNGADTTVGQVEDGRPAKMPPDSELIINPTVVPTEVYVQAGANPSTNYTDHAVEVASVMISTETEDSNPTPNGLASLGVAPSAKLYASAYVTGGLDPGTQDVLRTTQFLAKLFPKNNLQHITAVNHSWNKGNEETLSGNSLLTLGMDWIAMEHEVLNVIAGPEGGAPQTLPTDNYNGIVVASSGKNGGRWSEALGLGDALFDSSGQRALVDLLAPGEGVEVGQIGGFTGIQNGSSLAAPHVTAGATLLQQYANFQIDATATRWDFDNPRRHEVMKAVLLNAADRKSGVQGSLRDAKSRDGSGNYTWMQSIAFMDDTVPLDVEMGAGHLNVGRALTQFKPGEYNVGENIPGIGWDWHETGGTGTLLSYPFAAQVSGWVSITLAWDRQIDKIGGDDETYDPTNLFIGAQLNDLNVYLVPVGWDDLEADAVAKSTSDFDNVELIFKQVAAGMYEIVVDHHGGVGTEQDYGLAWWTGAVAIPGDFDNSGTVDGDDLVVWRGDFGMNGDSDADGDGDSDGDDFLVWQRNLGTTAVTPTAASVPEPASLLLCALGLPWLAGRRTMVRR
jgi:hypothetical protein